MENKASELFVSLIFLCFGVLIIGFFYNGASYIGWFLLLFVILFLIVLILSFLTDKGGNSTSNSRSFFGGNDIFERLERKYHEIAEKHIENKEYKKAARVYLRLLNNPYYAAKTLEDGKFYAEAATLYIKRLNDFTKAAECYIHAKDYKKAIELYKKEEEWEILGDLYTELQQKEPAHKYYNLAIEQAINNYHFYDAYEIAYKKLTDVQFAKEILLKAWNSNSIEAIQCLKQFLTFYEDQAYKDELLLLKTNIPTIQKNNFLKVLEYEFKESKKDVEFIKKLAIELIVNEKSTLYIHYLKSFYPEDRNLKDDLNRAFRL